MPFRSKAMSRAFHGAANNPEIAKSLGIPQSVARKFVRDSKGQDIKSLPERAGKATGGAIKPNW